jgi:hypothetical protein
MTGEQIKKHMIAAERLDLVKRSAFKFIQTKTGRISE